MKLIIINGPNLNLLGVREPDIYGKISFASIFDALTKKYPEADLHYFQSNHEGALIDKLHEIGFEYDGIIMNAGGLAHTSVVLADAVSAITTPVIEVHISNIYAREGFRHKSLLAPKCTGSITGLGVAGYDLAVEFFVKATS